MTANKNGHDLLLDPTLSEYLLDINSGVTYKAVDLNSVNYLYTTNSNGSADLTSSLLCDPQTSELLNTRHPTTSANPPLIISYTDDHLAVDNELDEIISVVQEDISHDKEIIKSCGKLPPVSGTLYQQKPSQTQIIHENLNHAFKSTPDKPSQTISSLTTAHNEIQITNEHLDVSQLNDVSVTHLTSEESQVNIDVPEDVSNLVETNKASTFIANEKQVTHVLSIENVDDPEDSSTLVLVSSNNILSKVDDEVTLEYREEVLQSVKDKLGGRKKPESSYWSLFESSKGKRAVYVCNICNQVFEQISHYYGHLRKHKDEFVYKCTECYPTENSAPITYSSQSQLKAHIRSAHNTERRFTCQLCSDSFPFPSRLFLHLNTVHKCARDLSCPLCPKQFYKKSDLLTHLGIHLQLKKHLCDVCGKMFSHSSNLSAHMRSHTGSRPYPCVHCGRRFRQINALNIHMATHVIKKRNKELPSSEEPPPNLDTEFPGAASPNSTDLSNSNSTQPAKKYEDPQRDNGRLAKKFYCLVCGQTFPYHLSLKRHVTELHETQKLFQCSVCVAIYHNVYEFLSHSCISGNTRSSSDPDLISDPEQLISLLTEILNSCNPATNRNEELMSILLSLNVLDETPPLAVVETDIPSPGEMATEQVFRSLFPSSVPLDKNASASSGLSDNNPTYSPSNISSAVPNMSGTISSSQTDLPYPSNCLASVSQSDSNFIFSDHDNIAVQDMVYLDRNAYFVSEPTEIPTSNGNSGNFSSTSSVLDDQSVNSYHRSFGNNYNDTVSSIPISCDITSSVPHEMASRSTALHANSSNTSSSNPTSSLPMSTNSLNSTSNTISTSNLSISTSNTSSVPTPTCGTVLDSSDVKLNPSRVVVSLANVERLKKMMNNSERTQEVLARIEDTLKRQRSDDKPMDPSPLPPSPPPCNKKSHCPHCEAAFTRRSSLRVHLDSIHNDRPDVAAQCDKCPLVFMSLTGLRGHMRRHHGREDESFVCDEAECERGFLSRHLLQVHKQRDHIRSRPHLCAQCPKTFFTAYDLKIHGRVHTGEKPYVCELCSLAYRHSSHLMRHRRLDHPNAK